MGLGMNAVIKVPTDDYGRMLPDKLDELIQKAIDSDQAPFMVGCTSGNWMAFLLFCLTHSRSFSLPGTTVFCAFDPLDKIAEVCSKYKIWMHVDACLGGTVLLSKRHSYLTNGIVRANSVSWNLHKMTVGLKLERDSFKSKSTNFSLNSGRSDAILAVSCAQQRDSQGHNVTEC